MAAGSIVFFSQEAPELRVGPGTDDDDVVIFHDGYAEIDLSLPDAQDRLAWVRNVRQWRVEELGTADEGRVRVDETVTNPNTCPRCGKAFSTKNALNGHLMSHRPKA